MLGIVAKCDSFFQMKLVSFGSDQFVQKWLSDIYSSSPGQIYIWQILISKGDNVFILTN
jgi:hypothetical protein